MQDAVFFAAAFATGRGAVDGALHRDGIARAPARISCMCMRAGMDARELECCGLLCGRLMSNAATGVCKKGVREILYTGDLVVDAHQMHLHQRLSFRENCLLEPYTARDGPLRMDGDVIEIVEGGNQMNGCEAGAAGGSYDETRNDIFHKFLFTVQEVSVDEQKMSVWVHKVESKLAQPDDNNPIDLRVERITETGTIWNVWAGKELLHCYVREVCPLSCAPLRTRTCARTGACTHEHTQESTCTYTYTHVHTHVHTHM
jgi:hypothetical protein